MDKSKKQRIALTLKAEHIEFLLVKAHIIGISASAVTDMIIEDFISNEKQRIKNES